MALSNFMKALQASGDNGPSYALDQLKNNPTWIQPVVTEMVKGLFLPEAILRRGPGTNSGAVAYREAEPLYSDDDIEIVGERGTYPALTFSRGPIRMSATQKRGAAIELTQEMIDRGNAGQFVENTKRATNTFARHWSRVFLNEVLTNMGIPQVTVTANTLEGGWHGDGYEGDGNTFIRKDVARAKYELQNARPDGDERENERFGFEPDTLVVHPLTPTAWINSDEINRIFMNSPAVTESLIYKFTEPQKLFGLDILKSWDMPLNKDPDSPGFGHPTRALLLERKTLGFISDERPFRTSPMYENKDNETWRSNMSRISTMAIDNPKAALWLNGIDGSGYQG